MVDGIYADHQHVFVSRFDIIWLLAKLKLKLKRKNNWKTKTKIKTKNKSKRKSHWVGTGSSEQDLIGDVMTMRRTSAGVHGRNDDNVDGVLDTTSGAGRSAV